MTPTDIQSALDALDAIANDGDIMSYREHLEAANKARAVIEGLRKDRERVAELQTLIVHIREAVASLPNVQSDDGTFTTGSILAGVDKAIAGNECL